MPGGQIAARILAFDEPPTASFSATPPAGIVPLSVTFDAASSSDADGDIVSYTWDFGDGAQASGPTQVHTFDNPGTFATRLTVTDVFGLSDEQTLSVDVVAPPNSLSGILLDTNAFVANGSQIPIVGAAVALLGTGVATTTDVNGHFILEGIPSGVQVLDLATANTNLAPDGSPYASFRENITIEPGDTVVSRPFYLPRIDVTSLTPVDPAVTTMVNNPGLGITMTVAPGAAVNEDGTPFTGQLSISEVLDGLAPASMPEEFEPGLLVTIQPVGVRFDPPAAIVVPNTDSLAPGIEMDIWSSAPSPAVLKLSVLPA
jgi:PKD repeat protein